MSLIKKPPSWHEPLSEFIEHPERLGHLLGFESLGEIHGQWAHLWLRVPQSGETVLQAHRNSFKTTTGIVAMALLALLYPNLRVLIVRKTVGNAEAIISALRQVFESEIMTILCQARYGLPTFKTKTWSDTRLLLSCKRSVTPEKSFEAAGVTNAQTGRHYDYIWADDIVTLDDRMYDSAKEHTKIYVQELSNIVTIKGSRMYTGTPWADGDAFSILPPALKYPIGSIEIEGIDQKWITDKKSRMTPALWSINYELVHTEDTDKIGNFFTVPRFTNEYRVAWIDSSFSDRKKSDSTSVGIVSFVPNPAVKIDLWDIEFTGKTWAKSITNQDVIKELLQFLNIYQPIETCLESQLGDSSQVFIDKLIAAEQQYNVTPRNLWTWQHQGKNKHEKIQFYVAGNKSRMRALKDCDPDFLAKVSNYSKGATHDDEADALADAVNLWQTSKYLVKYVEAFERLKKQQGRR